MEIKRCEKGHFYDAEANATCPQCAAEMEGGDAVFESYGPTEPAGGFGGGNSMQFDPYGSTVPEMGYRQDSPSPFEGNGKTTPLPRSGGFMPVQDYDAVTEVGPMMDGTPNPYNPGQGARFSPAAGWLACIEGPARGTDYRVRCGYNYIGRSEHMDICIRGDNQISRERHAQIAYDNRENVFFFGPADGKSIVRVNDKMIMGPTQIQAYDILSVGSTKLLFVPLCGERFNWNE